MTIDTAAPNRLSTAAQAAWAEYIALRSAEWWTQAKLLLLETLADAEAARRAALADLTAHAERYPDDSVEIERKSKTVDRLTRRVRITMEKIGLAGREAAPKKHQGKKFLEPWCYIDSAGNPRSWGADRDEGKRPDDALYWQACVALRKANAGTRAYAPTKVELRDKVLQLAEQAP